MRTLLAVALLSTAALADESSSPTANRLVHYVITRERYVEMMQQITGQMIAAMQAQGAQIQEADQRRLRSMMDEALTYDELSAISARIYSAHFTDKELDELIAFYRTDVGAKFMRELPGIAGDSMKETTRIVRTRLPSLLEKYGFAPKGQPQTPPPGKKAPKKT